VQWTGDRVGKERWDYIVGCQVKAIQNIDTC